jgi:hypothetical protein
VGSQIEGHEYQDNPDIHQQSSPELVSEEHQIDNDDRGDQQRDVTDGRCMASHFEVNAVKPPTLLVAQRDDWVDSRGA